MGNIILTALRYLLEFFYTFAVCNPLPTILLTTVWSFLLVLRYCVCVCVCSGIILSFIL